MFRRVSIVALVVMVVVGSLAVATAAEPKTDGKTKSPPKELTVDIGKGIELEMVLIPAGEFMMGAPDSEKGAFENEKPRHRVRITKRFYLGKYLVTQEQWECLMGNNPSAFQGPKKPVEQIVWKDCQHFLEKLNAKFGAHRGKFVLPSEAQWEYSCRAGGSTRFYFGDDEKKLGDYAWYDANSDNSTHPVGEKRPNAWGLYDMAGNVRELCEDWFGGEYYKRSPLDDPTGPTTGSYHVYRGGCWQSPAAGCSSATREIGGREEVNYMLGVRVALIPIGK